MVGRGAAGLLSLLALGCTCAEPREIHPADPAPSDVELRALARATNDLGWRIYEGIASDEQPNVVCSPLGAHLTLTMLEAGAAGETREELLRLLSDGEDEDALVRAVNATLYGWRGTGDARPAIHVVGRVWVDRGTSIHSAFNATLGERFGADIVPLSMRDDAAGSELAIGEWLARDGRLAPAVSIGPTTRLIAATQVSFSGRWAEPFLEPVTRPSRFERRDGSPIQVPTMQLSAELFYAETDDVVVVELPYVDPRFGLLLVRPRDAGSLDDVVASDAQLNEWIAALARRAVELWLPRFAIGPSTLELTPIIAELGLDAALDIERADFSRIGDGERLALSQLFQGARIDVDELGTRAEATTVASVVAASASPDPTQVRFDRPFLYVLRERQSGIALFLGRVGDPSLN